MSLVVVPADPNLELEPMSEAESAERELRARRIAASRDGLAGNTHWVSSTRTIFDGTYRRMFSAAKKRNP